jgi:hypothetical protein
MSFRFIREISHLMIIIDWNFVRHLSKLSETPFIQCKNELHGLYCKHKPLHNLILCKHRVCAWSSSANGQKCSIFPKMFHIYLQAIEKIALFKSDKLYPKLHFRT